MKNQEFQSSVTGAPSPEGDLQVKVTDPEIVDRHEARLSRVLEYQINTLTNEDSLGANLGSVNSGLMRVALWLDETIEQAMESGPRTIDQLQRMLPAVDTYLRVTRQIDRFAQLAVRAAELRKPKAASAIPAQPPIDSLPESEKEQSEDSEV